MAIGQTKASAFLANRNRGLPARMGVDDEEETKEEVKHSGFNQNRFEQGADERQIGN